MSVKQYVSKAVLSPIIDYAAKDPENNLPKLVDWMEKLGWDKDELATYRRVIEDKDDNWHKFLMSVFEDIDTEVLKTLFLNFGVNATFFGIKEQMANEEKYGCNIPWAILIDPTSACNLHCTGCWVAEYGNRLNLSYEELDNIIEQATDRWEPVANELWACSGHCLDCAGHDKEENAE